jgi:hypothetical protein
MLMEDLSKLLAGKSRDNFRGSDDKITPTTVSIYDSLIANLYFLLAVHEIFTAHASLVDNLVARPDEGRGDLPKDGPLHDLARSYMALRINPYLAADIVRATCGQISTDMTPLDSLSNISIVFLNEHRSLTGADSAPRPGLDGQARPVPGRTAGAPGPVPSPS